LDHDFGWIYHGFNTMVYSILGLFFLGFRGIGGIFFRKSALQVPQIGWNLQKTERQTEQT